MTSEKLKTVLITGATDGLGKAAAVLLAERGYRVFAAGRSAEKRAQLDAWAREKNLALETLDMDVVDDASVKNGVASVIARSDGLDVLINNAGIIYVSTVEDTRMEDWRRQFETNFFGVVRVTQAVLPHMRTRQRGRILMMIRVWADYSADARPLQQQQTRHGRAEQRAAPGNVSVWSGSNSHRARIYRDQLGEHRGRFDGALRGQDQVWPLCQNLCGSVRGLFERQDKVKDYAGRLRARHAGSHRNAASEATLWCDAPGEEREVGQAPAFRQHDRFRRTSQIRDHARRLDRSWLSFMG